MSDDSLTARNRINQRNFRARRQNYIKELEERIRKYESDGVQATIEIQAAARQVTDQNIKLRNLLITRYGMSELDISNHLGYPQQSPLIANQFTNPFGSNSQLANLAPAPSSTQSSITSEFSHSYPTPPQQTDLSRSSTNIHLDPALSLASLHRFPSNQENRPLDTTSYRNSIDNSTTHLLDTKSSPYNTRAPDSPTDTLSESSNPVTPAEQMQLDSRPNRTHSHSDQPCCRKESSSSVTIAPRANDETTCEEAARIIASMRGGDGNPDQVMLDLGCTDVNAKCKVKNLSIFQLMDRQ